MLLMYRQHSLALHIYQSISVSHGLPQSFSYSCWKPLAGGTKEAFSSITTKGSILQLANTIMHLTIKQYVQCARTGVIFRQTCNHIAEAALFWFYFAWESKGRTTVLGVSCVSFYHLDFGAWLKICLTKTTSVCLVICLREFNWGF